MQVSALVKGPRKNLKTQLGFALAYAGPFPNRCGALKRQKFVDVGALPNAHGHADECAIIVDLVDHQM